MSGDSTRTRPSIRAGATLAAGLLLLAAAVPAAAQDADRAAERGALLYRIHCSSCHGDDATGGGPVADVLEIPPPDLTRVAAAHGGDFPEAEIRSSIDGREEIAGHGRREMPVWGLTFQQRGLDADQEAEVRGRIDDLLAYLRSIQRTEEDAPASGEPSDDTGALGASS